MDVNQAVKAVGELESFDLRLLAEVNNGAMPPQHCLPGLGI